MTSDKDLYAEIAGELGDEEGFSGDREYGEKSQRAPRRAQVVYKVWNNNPQKPEAAKTPGIVMSVRQPIAGAGKDQPKYGPWVQEVTDKVVAVILYTSSGRELNTGSGPAFRTVCSSHDGETPSIRIAKPLCRNVTKDDLAQTFSKWKGFDAAKVDAKVAEITQGEDRLQFCGLKTKDGFITLCPYGKKDPVTGVKAACKQHIYVRAYDIVRKREFDMKLTGSSIATGKFVAPYHEFFKFLRSSGQPGADGKIKGLPSYAFRVDLSALQDNAFYLLNVSNWRPIESAENRNEMKEKALLARESYEKQAAFLSKEQYDANKKAAAPAQPQVTAIAPPVLVSTRQVAALGPVGQTSFEDDDINF